MLPFDLDLASSGFVDAHGQRRQNRCQSRKLSCPHHCEDICVEPDCPQPTCRTKVPQGRACCTYRCTYPHSLGSSGSASLLLRSSRASLARESRLSLHSRRGLYDSSVWGFAESWSLQPSIFGPGTYDVSGTSCAWLASDRSFQCFWIAPSHLCANNSVHTALSRRDHQQHEQAPPDHRRHHYHRRHHHHCCGSASKISKASNTSTTQHHNCQEH